MEKRAELTQEELDCLYIEYKGEKFMVLENAIDYMLEFNILYISSYRIIEEEKQETIFTLFVGLNDMFWWACADHELLLKEDVEKLFNYCFDEQGKLKYNGWGNVIWACVEKRHMRPQHPVEDMMKEQGVWIDELEALPVRDFTG